MRQVISLTITIFLFFGTLPVYALPMYSNAQCIQQSFLNWPFEDSDENNSPLPNYTKGDPLFVYIEDDIGQEMKSCMIAGGISDEITGLSNSEVNRKAIKTIISALEVWNLETRGVYLQYKGTINSGSADEACPLMQKPAVFIRFINGCRITNNLCHSPSPTASAGVFNISNCDNVSEIMIYGDQDTQNICSGNVKDFSMDSLTNHGLDLKALMVHEFGHILGLGDLYTLTDDPSSSYSVMFQSPNVNQRHLYPWDRDCVDDIRNNNHTSTKYENHYNHAVWNSIQNISSLEYDAEFLITPFISGGGFNNLLNINNYYRYREYFLESTQVNTDGILSWDNNLNSSQVIYEDDLWELQYPPIPYSPIEKTNIQDQYRITFTPVIQSIPYDGNYSLIDPPAIKFINSSNKYFSSGSTNSYAYYQSTLYLSIKSHIPMVSAWDGYSENTVFVSVDTNRNDGGVIRIYPGFYNGLSWALRTPTELRPGGQNIPGNSSFPYTLRTDLVPGVACAPLRNNFPYNCVLAWVDRGSAEGEILYTYFKIDNNIVHWLGTIYKRSNYAQVSSVTGVSSAYYNGDFYLAWKDSYQENVKYSQTNNGGYASWDNVVTIVSNTDVSSVPTWSYIPNATAEFALTWTTIQPQ